MLRTHAGDLLQPPAESGEPEHHRFHPGQILLSIITLEILTAKRQLQPRQGKTLICNTTLH